MLKVAPHSRASWLHAHSCLFWAVLLWFWALSCPGFGKDHLLHLLLCLLSPSCFPGPFSNRVILATQAHSQCFTGSEISSTLTHKCRFCLQFLKIRRQTLPHVICQMSLAHLAFCLVDNDSCRRYSPEQHQIKICQTAQNLIHLINYTAFLNVK